MSLRSIKLSGRALELAKEAHEVWASMHDDVREIERKAGEAMEQRKADGQALVKVRMNALFDVLGIPVTDRAYYVLEAKYLRDHGDAYINQVVETAEPTVEVVPERKKLN